MTEKRSVFSNRCMPKPKKRSRSIGIGREERRKPTVRTMTIRIERVIRGLMMKQNTKLRYLVMSSMLAALCCVATLVVQIPTPTQGYLHLGDAVVLLSGWLLGPVWGAVAAGLGSMLADVFSGYILYAPATLVIKAAVAVIGWIFFRIFAKIMPKLTFVSLILSGILAEIVMIGGYFLFEALFVGYGWGALVGVPLNMLQGAFGVIVGAAMMNLLKKILFRVHWEYNIK